MVERRDTKERPAPILGDSAGDAIPGGLALPIRLSLPSDARLLSVARLAAAAMASLAELDVDLAEDVKLAVSEITLAMIEHGGGGLIELTIVAHSVPVGSVQIDATNKTETFDATHPDFELCWAVIAGISAASSYRHVDGVLSISALIRDASN